jgi:antitoxin (DNA-binding transcriptional repressor) of toxin-antitoxin stability system
LIVTRQGKLVAALVPAASDDWEDSVVANDPGFAAVMKRSEKRYRAEGGASIDEVRARYGMPAKPAPKRRPRKAASSR